MTEELQQAVETGKLSQTAAATLESLPPGAFCHHKSWGFGQVAEWRLITGQIIIDFKTKKGHPMQAQYAAENVTLIPTEHILARLHREAATVKEQAAQDPVALVKSILVDHKGKATVDQISAILVPEVFDAAGFKKWWDGAKKKLKADGHFTLPAKRTEPIEWLETATASHVGLLTKFQGARYLKDQILALDQILKSLNDFANEVDELRALSAQIEDAAQKGRKLQSAQAIELLLARDEIISRHEALAPGEGAPTVADILVSEQHNLPAIFQSLPASKHRSVLEFFPAAFGERWTIKAIDLMQNASARLVMEVYRLFDRKQESETLRLALARLISERSIATEALYWLSKERGGPFKELFNADLLSAVFSAMERDQLSEKRSSRLHDLLFEDRELLTDFLEGADRETVRDSTRKLIMTPVFDDLNRRSLLARIIKLYPEMQSMVGGDSGETREALTVSWASLDRRKKDYDDLVNKLIPQNVKDIATARSYGDLRENFEFKSAKEQQAVLARRKAELELMLANARGTNFEEPDTAQVSIGTIVTLAEPATGQTETYSILGAWDSAPDRGVISYKAAIGQALLGHAVGDTVDLASEGGKRTVRIDRIEPFKNLELLQEIADSAISA